LRDNDRRKSFYNIEEDVKEFFYYLEETIGAGEDLRHGRASMVIRPVLRNARQDFDHAAGEALAKANKRKRPDYMQLLTDSIKHNIEDICTNARSSCFDDVEDKAISIKPNPAI
jgi:hypothetical protein